MLGTPGPVVLALAGTGAAYGVRASLPFLAGILCGGVIVITLSAAGISTMIAAFPFLEGALKLAAFLYFLYLARSLYRSGDRVGGAVAAQSGTPPSFVYGFFFSLVNPKAYAAFAAIFASFAVGESGTLSSLTITGFVSFMCIAVLDIFWLFIGGVLQGVMAKPKVGRLIRIGFALAIIIAAGISLASF